MKKCDKLYMGFRKFVQQNKLTDYDNEFFKKKKGTSGNPIGRPKGSVSTTTKLIREHISQAIEV